MQTLPRRAPSLPEPVGIGETPHHPALSSPWWGGTVPPSYSTVVACKSQQRKAATPPKPPTVPTSSPPTPKTPTQHSAEASAAAQEGWGGGTKLGTARGWGDRGRQVGNRRVAPQEGHRVELTRCKKSGKEERAPNSGRQRCLVSKIAVSCHQEWEGTSRVTLCSRAQGLEGTPSWGPIHQGSPAPYTGTVGTGAQGLGNLEKLLPAHPWYGGLSVQHQCGPSCRDLWQLGQEGTRDTAPVKKRETRCSPGKL